MKGKQLSKITLGKLFISLALILATVNIITATSLNVRLGSLVVFVLAGLYIYTGMNKLYAQARLVENMTCPACLATRMAAVRNLDDDGNAMYSVVCCRCALTGPVAGNLDSATDYFKSISFNRQNTPYVPYKQIQE